MVLPSCELCEVQQQPTRQDVPTVATIMGSPTVSNGIGGVLPGRDFQPGTVNMVKNSRLGRP